MALTPADFAAYSRATGTSYPESPEERAQMAPEVRAFRQNQLQAPQQQESNSLALGLGIGLGLAGVGGGLMALRGRAKKGGKKDVAGKSSVKMADLSDLEAPAGSYGPSVELKDYPGQSLALRTQPAQDSSSQINSRKLAQDQFASSVGLQLEAPIESYGPNVDLKDYPLTRKQEVYQAVAKKPVTELPQVSRPQGAVEESMLITDSNTGEVYRRGGDASIRSKQAQENLSNRVDELLAEVSVGEAGQMLAGREVAAETRQMMGTESSRQSAAVRRLEKEEERQAKNILSELAQETPTLTETYETFGEPAAKVQNIEALDTASDQAAAPIERAVQRNEDVDVSAAQSFLNQQRDKLQSQGLSPTRVERVLASNPELIEAAELYASTGDEAVLSRFSEQPASPITVKPKSVLSLDSDELATGSLFKSGTFDEFVDDLENKDVNLTNRISSLGAEQQQLTGRRKQLEEDSLMIKSAMDREPIDKDDYSRMYGQMQYEMQNMPEPASLNVDIGDAMAERDNVRAQLKGLKELGAQQFLIDQTEGVRPFYEVNPATNEIIPETLEIRPGRKSIELTKGGGGRNVSEFTAGMREPDLKQRTVLVPVNESALESKRPGAVFGPWPKDSLPPLSSISVKTRSSDDVGNQLTGFEGDRTQTGGRIGLYGPERTDRKGERATARQRPTQVTEDEIINQALMDSTADELGIPTPPDRDLVFIRTPRQQSQNPLKASEAVRRANIEGRDPQKVLRSMGFGV